MSPGGNSCQRLQSFTRRHAEKSVPLMVCESKPAARTAFTLSKAYDMCLLSLISLPHPRKDGDIDVGALCRDVFKVKARDWALFNSMTVGNRREVSKGRMNRITNLSRFSVDHISSSVFIYIMDLSNLFSQVHIIRAICISGPEGQIEKEKQCIVGLKKKKYQTNMQNCTTISIL